VDRPIHERHSLTSEAPGLTERLYRRLLDSLKDAYSPGDRFPSERDVARRFGVSRPTAARAMSRLMDEGLIESRKGAGRFVRRPPLDYDLSSLVSFTARCRAEGVVPTTEVLDFTPPGLGSLPDTVVRELQLLPGEGAYSLIRRRFADGRPVILEHRWLAARFCPGLAKADAAGSLYELLLRRYGLSPAGARQVIRVTALGGRDRALFWEDESSVAFETLATGYLEGGVPLWYERTLYLGSAYEFHNRLGPLSTARPAVGVLRPAGEKP
jgi:DNA-binding GntR family transcriptional regulator